MEITLVPTAGLCNRMNAITSGICYKEKHKDVKLQIYWEKTPDCCAYFTDLFEPIPDYDIKPLKKFYLKTGKKNNLFLPDILKKIHFDAYYYGASYDRMNFDSIIQNNKNIYISAYNAFTPFGLTSSLGKMFIPIDKLQKRISRITGQYNDNVIGIHIRRTDNAPAIKNNPLTKFTTLMDKEIQLNKDIRFYLATDSEEVKNELKEKYGNKIMSMPMSLTRNTLQGMQDAIVDLYCLGSTKRIIGCTNSTYSLMASRLFNIELSL